MTKLGQWDPNGQVYNDVWGYADGNGNEFAIIGSRQKVHFIDVTVPTAPTLKKEFTPSGQDSNGSVWRDFKTYSHYAYAVADEASEGLVIYDLSDLNSITQVYQDDRFFHRTHNIYIDNGRLYALGSYHPDSLIRNMVVLDIATNPANPTQIARVSLPGGYIHDAFVRNDTAYCSHGNNGYYIYDFSDAENPVELGNITSYPQSGYNHSSWLSDRDDAVIFADENKNLGIKYMDVSDLNSLQVLPSQIFKSTLEAPVATNSIGHNPFIKGDFVFISYYHDGIQVYDISDPNNITNVAYYDTYPINNNYSGSNGCWGAYPYLPSGIILGSDLSYGLYVLELAPALLPVELSRFTAKAKDEKVLLSWATSSERNNAYFDVEKSTDGIYFEKITRVDGNNNANQEIDYIAWDENPFNGVNYYRLKQVDLNGDYSYSKTEVVAYEAMEVTVYPSLVDQGQSLQVEFGKNSYTAVQLYVFDASGRMVFEQNYASMGAGEQLQIPTDGWERGNYILTVQNNQRNITRKFSVMD